METAAIILAAGAGTRMKSKKPKVVHEVLGRPLVRWVVEAAKEAGADRVVTVVGHMRDQVIPLVEGDTEVVVQEAQRGTLMRCWPPPMPGRLRWRRRGALRRLPAHSARDHSPDGGSARRAQRGGHRAHHGARQPFGYGRIVRDGAGEVARIVEQKDASPEEAAITECQLRRLLLRRPAPFRRAFPGEFRQRPGRVLSYRRAGHQPRRRAARARL